MRAIVLLLLGIITPAAMFTIALVPSYAGFFYATKVIYGLQNIDLSEQALNVLYIARVYLELFTYWLAHMQQLSFLQYTLPLLLIPLIGVGISVTGAIIFTSFMLTRFRNMAS